MVITESDTILQEYYITRRYKRIIHEGIYIIKAERCSRAAREDLESRTGEELEGRATTTSKLRRALTTMGGSAACYDQLQQGHHGPGSRIWK